MVGSSKILTVSYGTFSCTLEGFDQPFETMKSIAEYFRDLAADDRYFGAEPPQPDMQMLHQIAEREVKRRVETTVQKNGIMLRQTTDALAGSNPAVAAPRERSDDDRRPSAPRSDPADNTPFEVDIDGDSVAAKLSRIRAVVARARANRSADIAFVEDEPIEAYLNQAPAVPEDADQQSPEPVDDFATESAATDDSEPPVSLASLIAATDIAEISDSTEAEQAAEAAQAAEQAAEAAQEAEQATEAARAAQAAEQAAEAARAAQAAEQEAEQAAEAARAAQEAEQAAEADRAAQAAEQAAEAARAAQAVASVAQHPIARVIKLKRIEFEAALAAGEIEEVEDDDFTENDDLVAEIEMDDDEDVAIADMAEDDSTGTLAAVLAKTDDDGADSVNVFSDDGGDSPEGAGADDSLTEGIRELIGQTSLDQDAAADLAAELAALQREATEAEIARGRSQDADLGDDTGFESEVARQSHAEPTEDSDERALNRLLEETNTKLSETEGSRRRSAIAHLKAAVAATRADRLLKGNRTEPDEDESLNRYRDDLAQVVRPRRPVSGVPNPGEPAPRERPADRLAARPAPLVLVSAQRVDQPVDGAARIAPVRPRRVSVGQSTTTAEVEQGSGAIKGKPISFSDYAHARGASELTDVLEAAIAYAAEIEGQAELSRPQILRKAAALRPDLATSREKGLQSFGQLLRSGRIRKVGLGQFALNEAHASRQNRA